ncbi:UBX domain-containing protein 10 [Basidiobolus ranarum]|uniref:UBX domain-containing protein 10 n=1 Tax=Basidiobolus ranarum TaxID=34480 RepID=A0ABR2X2D7_9FUNG
MSTSDSLTSEQEEILLNFQAVTDINDVEKAVTMLRQNNWNIETAVRVFLDDESQGSNVQEESSTSRNKPETSSGTRHNDIPAPPGVSIASLVSFPVTLVWGVLGGLFTLLYSLFVPANRTVTQGGAGNSRSIALKFIQEFEENYGGVRPEFFVGGYSEALSRAKRDVKYLLVILLSEGPENNRTFCQNTLSSERLINFLREQEVIVWGGDTRGPDGYQVSTALQARTYPFVGLIGLQSAPNGVPKMTLIEKIQGQTTPDVIIQRLTIQFQRTSTELQRAKSEHQERQESRSIREQQDEAYRQSLLADQEKERKAREERERVEKERSEVERIEKARAKLEADRLKYRQYLITVLPNEPSTEEPNTARLSFKMPSGERVVRRFRGDEKVEDVYAFVDTYSLSADRDFEAVSQNPVPDYVHEYTFHLVSPFPRTVVELSSKDLKIRDVPALWPSANLLIEDLDLED